MMIYFTILSLQEFSSYSSFEELFDRSFVQNRRTASTKLNASSSRSHAAVMLKITTEKSDGKKLVGKLYLVDLAGSEDNRRTGNVGKGLGFGFG